MKEITLALDSGLLAQLGLEPTASAADIGAKIKAALVKAQKVDALQGDVTRLEGELQTAKDALEAEKAAVVTKEVTAELENAVSIGAISEEEKTIYAKDYATNPDGLKAILKARKPYTSITGQLGRGGADKTELEKLTAMSFDELWKSDKLATLKAQAPDVFKAKYKEKYGREPRM